MRTSFTPAQLADPAIAEAEKILRTCVHCGFCTATCPSFVVQRDELDSPRGRIYLIKEMLEHDRPADKDTTRHLDRCLSCLSCMTTCPSGVDYMHLVDMARARVTKTAERPLHDRALRWALAQILPHRGRVRAALVGAVFARPFAPLIGLLPVVGKRLKAMLKLSPAHVPPRRAADRPGSWPAETRLKGRVIVLQGCVQPVLRPSINESAIRLLTRAGYDVVQVKNEGCCGALVHHMGEEAESRAQAAHNIRLWWAETKDGGGRGVDAILITASGCGTSVKDYGHLFARDAEMAGKAKAISALTRDISEFVLTLDLPAPSTPHTLKVAYHAACSMQHGQKIKDQPKTLLRQAGYEVAEVADGHLCCGSAGVYNILQPEIAGDLKSRKLANIAATGATIVATGNIGCMAHLSAGSGLRIVHTIELLDWAHGGREPER